MYTNDTLGGLLNATFGNATEMIISGAWVRGCRGPQHGMGAAWGVARAAACGPLGGTLA